MYIYPKKCRLKLSFIRKKKDNFLDTYRLDDMIQFLYASFISLLYFGIFVGVFRDIISDQKHTYFLIQDNKYVNNNNEFY